MLFKIKPEEKTLFALLKSCGEELGFPTYLVGGYVRDRLLDRISPDIDVVCVGDGIKLAEKLASKLNPHPHVTVFKRFGTAMLRYKGMEIEFVGARKESYSPDSRKPSVENGSLQDDQNRRDFTINAMAVSLNENDYGQILDPFNGLNDLDRKILRTPLEPDTTFIDDPLRMMRAIRFSTQLGFTIEDRTLEAIKRNKHRISIVSAERITKELEKIILTKTPSHGFKLLLDAGLLKLIFPEMVELHGVEVRNNLGHKDNFYHTLEVLDNVARVSDEYWLRWAAICHDIAKPATKRFETSIGWTFHGHEVVGTAITGRIFRKLKLPLDHKLKYVQKLVLLHLRPIALTNDHVTDSAVRRLLFDAGDDISDLMILCEADITSKNEGKVNRYKENYKLLMEKIKEVEEKDHLRNWQPPVSGEEIMEMFNLSPSREVGLLKTALREAILDGDVPNEREEALSYLTSKAKEIGIG